MDNKRLGRIIIGISALCAAFGQKPEECYNAPEPVIQEAVPAGSYG